MTEPAPSTADSISTAEVRQVIVRACQACGAGRHLGEPCAVCGNPLAPTVEDLGVVTAQYRNPLRQAWWQLVGKPLADRRVRRANRRATNLRAKKE